LDFLCCITNQRKGMVLLSISDGLRIIDRYYLRWIWTRGFAGEQIFDLWHIVGVYEETTAKSICKVLIEFIYQLSLVSLYFQGSRITQSSEKQKTE